MRQHLELTFGELVSITHFTSHCPRQSYHVISPSMITRHLSSRTFSPALVGALYYWFYWSFV
ncbi:MAG: hypothetical protein KC443_24445, partial [Anaerolineales bacterium]|nr:hypothetical protein [Anaerolineales bacterium]